MREAYDTEKTQAPGFDPRELREARENINRCVERCTEDVTSAGKYPPKAVIGGGRDPFDELFRYHPPTPQDLPKFQAINQAAKNFAEVVRANCPRCEDFINAIERIREARMWANSAIGLQGRI